MPTARGWACGRAGVRWLPPIPMIKRSWEATGLRQRSSLLSLLFFLGSCFFSPYPQIFVFFSSTLSLFLLGFVFFFLLHISIYSFFFSYTSVRILLLFSPPHTPYSCVFFLLLLELSVLFIFSPPHPHIRSFLLLLLELSIFFSYSPINIIFFPHIRSFFFFFFC